MARPGIRLGLRANVGQFALLVAVNALVGGMVGQERTVLPLLATEVFGLAELSSALAFIVAFGFTKAVANFAAGALSDRYGRKPVLVAGCFYSPSERRGAKAMLRAAGHVDPGYVPDAARETHRNAASNLLTFGYEADKPDPPAPESEQRARVPGVA